MSLPRKLTTAQQWNLLKSISSGGLPCDAVCTKWKFTDFSLALRGGFSQKRDGEDVLTTVLRVTWTRLDAKPQSLSRVEKKLISSEEEFYDQKFHKCEESGREKEGNFKRNFRARHEKIIK